jgi:hypothetical protein
MMVSALFEESGGIAPGDLGQFGKRAGETIERANSWRAADRTRDDFSLGSLTSLSSSPAKAGDPVTTRFSMITGCPAFAWHDRREAIHFI